MSKTDFLEILGTQLLGQIPDGRASGHVRYYRNYIEEQIGKGRSEEEVLNELGDPRLIARTILDTDPEAGQGIYEEYVSQGYEDEVYHSRGYEEERYDNEAYGGRSDGRMTYDKYDSDKSGRGKHHSYHLDLSTWYGKAIVIAIAAFLIIGLLFLIGTILPFIIVAGLLLSIISWLRRR